MYTLPELPYDKKVFDPIISEEGFDYHHGKHHNAYVNNLNNLIKDTEWSEKALEEIIVESLHQQNTGLFNNAAQHFNHTFYWKCLSPNGGGTPSGAIAELIVREFGSFEKFRDQFSDTATKLFGSGWAWLVLNEENKLEIEPLKDAHTPLTSNKKPLLTLDVWEHAYYIDHRNQRPKFIEGFWEIVNWDFANQNLARNE